VRGARLLRLLSDQTRGHQVFAAAQPAFLDAVERHFTSHIDQDTLAHLTELRARITAAAVGADQKTR